MAGDYTRFTHQPEKRYSGVLMQQGRVQLDADANEQVAIQKRRWEVQAFDTFCGCAVPDTTPDGFQVTVEGGDLQLGVGRMYVHGLLAEIFEGEVWSYLDQPFLPHPPPAAGDRVLVYLDVWDREVTWVQDPDLREKALQGPDTTTRVQTVWQVKQHSERLPSRACETRLDEVFPPSAGRLSSRAVVPPASGDPCIVSPAGGYRGLENRLYRLEIHDPGQAGDLSTARFKWSRENASVVSPVAAIDNSREVLTVRRIGRDPVLRFKAGDWVELNDDHRELMGEAGAMARVLGVDEANREITLDRAMPADFDAADSGRHTRLLRWDQKGDNSTLDGDGLIAASSSWTLLEDGVEIRLALDPAGISFHVADYWVFAARTVDGSVEELTAAAPRGIVHHYCALAELAAGAAGAGLQRRRDCRRIYRCGGRDGGPPLPPAEPRCCVVVEPGGNIQAAIDELPAAGGCVCLKAGTHAITDAIQIASSNVVLRGESLGAEVVRSNGGVRALSIGSASGPPTENVAVRDLRFTVSGGQDAAQEILFFHNCRHLSVVDCQLSAPAAPGAPAAAAGVHVEGSRFVEIRGNRIHDCGRGIVARGGGELAVRANVLERLHAAALDAADLSGTASVADNSFSGSGAPPLVRVSGEGLEKIIYNNNLCEHPWPEVGEDATVFLAGEHQIVMGNHVNGGLEIPSIDFNKPGPPTVTGKVAVMGNLTTGKLVNVGIPVPQKYEDFNALV